jgi:transcriptional regulator with XRE-family HTH domain
MLGGCLWRKKPRVQKEKRRSIGRGDLQKGAIALECGRDVLDDAAARVKRVQNARAGHNNWQAVRIRISFGPLIFLATGPSIWSGQCSSMTQKFRKNPIDNRKTGNIDTQIGKRLRQMRIIRRLSQEALGSRLGIAPQQVHKYEIGQNRITATRLYQCAEALDVSVSSFYIGLTGPSSHRDEIGAPAAPPSPAGHLSVQEVDHLTRIVSAIDDAKLRRKIIELVEAFVARRRKARL